MAIYNEKHQEVPDKTPIALPLNYSAPEPLEQMIARLIRQSQNFAPQMGKESFEESDDFETEDDNELVSQHQFTDMQEEHLDYPIQKEVKKPAPLLKKVVESEPNPEAEKA
ncbi:MAG: hypothetical protein [Microvirus sp.]|nr:MAG: hypothetical protein [Microvirus sp.]